MGQIITREEYTLDWSQSKVFLVLYADDIVLLAPTVSGLQRILHVCEKELEQLDMKINQ